MIALALKKDPTLTPAHAEALGSSSPGRHRRAPGEDLRRAAAGERLFRIARQSVFVKWVFGPGRSSATLTSARYRHVLRCAGPWLNAENDDLGPSPNAGQDDHDGGSVDEVVPCWASIDYYERVVTREGSLEKAQEFLRFT